MKANIKQKQKLFSVREGYDRLAHHYSKTKWYAFWEQYEKNVVSTWLQKIIPESILDIGCGTGIYVPTIAELDSRYLGIDISSKMIAQAIKTHKEILNHKSSIKFSISSLEEFQTRQHFSAILCTRVLSHLKRLDFGIEKISKLLKAGDYLLLTDIHPDHNYINSGFQTPTEKIYIETFKHDIPELESSFIKHNLKIIEYNEYTFDHIPHSEVNYNQFEKLFHYPENPIFFTIAAKKEEKN